MRLAAAGVILAAMLLGCSSQRSLETVRRDGDWAYERGDYQTAYNEYSEVIDRSPGDWAYRVNLAKTLLVLERPQPAREHLAVAYTLRPNDETIVELYAQSMLESGDHDGLFRFLRQRVDDRRSVSDYLRLGHFAIQAGDVDEAERALLTAARIDTGRSLAPQLALAELYAHIGDETRALRRLRMALFIEPGNEVIQQRIRALGKIPGPSFALTPDEMQD